MAVAVHVQILLESSAHSVLLLLLQILLLLVSELLDIFLGLEIL